MNKYEKVDLAYNFLVEKEKESEAFTVLQLMEATEWKADTCRTYLSKRWYQYLEKDGEQYSSSGIAFLSKNEFRAVHSQKLQQVIDHSVKGILLHKAKEFALLAVSTYNNPYTEFKTYGFIVNIVIAYTSLMHAIFEKKGIDYFHKDANGRTIFIDGEEKSWELRDCIDGYWQGFEAPEKANIKFLIGLRNKIEHRSLPAIDLAVSGECQSALSNFETILVEEFGDEHALTASLAIAMQLTRISEQAQIDALKQLQKDNYKAVRRYMETYRNDLNDDVVQSQKYRVRAFLVPKLGNHAKSADMAIEFINVNKLSEQELENYEQGVAFIKGVENPFKLRPSKVVDLVSKKIPFFNIALHTKCWKFYDARPRGEQRGFKGEFSGFVEGFEGYLYSLYWSKFLIEELKKPEVLSLVKQQAI
ncbi:DUF3644 domain-containing protein [Pseudoalteromonas arctica]|uniref:DUF3644 domain-containing protein n=1 Tax=Pseudoalteromonas arctica A 37-1-2 TaxID=1117313 RepID=A0A290S9A7_9GAMM|nr:DUF3644 domain-containing protein [Pseudoalteromonas arctica]ATC87601.1 hypothetical protein PARC_a3188 [Pseudoalteromonas arctica A 37-1-2]